MALHVYSRRTERWDEALPWICFLSKPHHAQECVDFPCHSTRCCVTVCGLQATPKTKASVGYRRQCWKKVSAKCWKKVSALFQEPYYHHRRMSSEIVSALVSNDDGCGSNPAGCASVTRPLTRVFSFLRSCGSNDGQATILTTSTSSVATGERNYVGGGGNTISPRWLRGTTGLPLSIHHQLVQCLQKSVAKMDLQHDLSTAPFTQHLTRPIHPHFLMSTTKYRCITLSYFSFSLSCMCDLY